MYKVESIKSSNIPNTITITIIDTESQFSIDFYKQKDGTFINLYHRATTQLSLFLIENGFVTPHTYLKYANYTIVYGIQLTNKSLLLTL